MIYPEFFPDERLNEKAEKRAFDQLKKLSDQYDIFYAKRFVNDGWRKKPEFEIDFIVCIPNEAIVCIEVKGGLINYDGVYDRWSQNRRTLKKRPDTQAISNAHGLANMYPGLIGGIPVSWALCFPECDISDASEFPSSINPLQLIDQVQLFNTDKVLPELFQHIKNQNPTRKGIKHWQYNKFKQQLLRGIGFVQLLNTKFKYQTDRFIQLTNRQIDLFKRVGQNNKIIASGPAGCGKTILAKTLAQDFLEGGSKVLFMCFNRTLANKIRYDFDRNEENLTVSTFHSLARQIITADSKDWWANHKGNPDFWDLEVPNKLEQSIDSNHQEYDVLIIDEGQDFKAHWFEILFSLVKETGRKMVFLDEKQNIFKHFEQIPKQHEFFKYTLAENCRNTKNIVNHLSELIDDEIQAFDNSPTGETVTHKVFPETVEQLDYINEQIKHLITEQQISSEQITLLINSPREDSCIAECDIIGDLKLEALDNKDRRNRNTIYFTTINTFKGLESDVVFVLDCHKIINDEYKALKLYTQASRARHLLFLLEN